MTYDMFNWLIDTISESVLILTQETDEDALVVKMDDLW